MFLVKRRLVYIACALCVCCTAWAQGLGDNARISLITCSPGEELYAKYGHTAIRVYDPNTQWDVVFNYGIFDFNTELFYWKFMRGETWYELGATSTHYFMSEYASRGRTVYEQTLHISPAQRDSIWQALVTNYLPENRKYLYNFVFDNCATRPFLLINNALGGSIESSYIGHTGESYRSFLRHYTGRHSWANAGINLLFGPKADQTMGNTERLFLPEELMFYIEQATLTDGTPLAPESKTEAFSITPTPWYATWELGLAIYFLIILAFSLYDRKRNRWSWGVELAAGIPYVLLLMIVCFLTFFSCHPLVGFGWRLLIIPITHLCARLVYIFR